MKKLILAMMLVAASTVAQGQPNPQPSTRDAKAEQEIRAVRQELVDAGTRKDRATYERLIAEASPSFIAGSSHV